MKGERKFGPVKPSKKGILRGGLVYTHAHHVDVCTYEHSPTYVRLSERGHEDKVENMSQLTLGERSCLCVRLCFIIRYYKHVRSLLKDS